MSESLTLAEFHAELAAESEIFFAELGRAIARCSTVEWALYGVFAYALGTRDSEAARAAFYANHAFYAKLAMVESAFVVRFGNTQLNEFWPAVAEKARKRSLVRNHLAHTSVAMATQQPKGKRRYMDVGVSSPALHPSITGRPRTKYYFHDLQKVTESFLKLSENIRWLEFRIERFLEGKSIE